VIPNDFGYTYPKAVFVDGSIYVFFRSRDHGGSNFNQGKYAYIKSDDYGNSWSEQIEFVDASQGVRAISVYPTSAKYANGYLHVAWYIKCESGDTADYYGPGTRETRHNVYYAKSPNGVTWYNVDKSHSSTYITMGEMDKFYQVYNTTTQTKVVGSYSKDYYGPGLDFIRYRTTKPPIMDVSSSGIPYIGLQPTDDGSIIRYWKESEWRTIHLPSNVSYIPYIVSKEISEMPVNALGYFAGNIYLTHTYRYDSIEWELNII
jgi:hypothetical protein